MKLKLFYLKYYDFKIIIKLIVDWRVLSPHVREVYSVYYSPVISLIVLININLSSLAVTQTRKNYLFFFLLILSYSTYVLYYTLVEILLVT